MNEGTSAITIVTFLIYIGGVFLLAIFSHKLLSKSSFMGEYFLGSRGLGSWALAFTFAATSSSGGSFTGFPALIYSYGWILALWIASYMVVPVCTMGVLGKRLNQVARKSGAITIPDVLRDRFNSTFLGLFATCTIIFFTVANLVAQFKAGALIVEETFNLSKYFSDYSYLWGLVIFAVVVVFYTAYGGFRAVVWTDVMQGIVMGAGVIILVPVILYQAGGLTEVNRKIRNHPPHLVTSISGKQNDLAFVLKKAEDTQEELPVGVEYVVTDSPNTELSVKLDQTVPVDDSSPELIVRVNLATDQDGNVETKADDIKNLIEQDSLFDRIFEKIVYAFDNDGSGNVAAMSVNHFIHGKDFLFGPGRRKDASPFHPLGMGLSFFFMWAISGMGQPGTMVRLMAFEESRTLKRAVFTVTFYYALIYLPLVFIFIAARTLLPYIPQEDADKSMVLVATRVVSQLGWQYKILAAIFVAAPFAAIMSTVDSFLLMISSSLVRDVYQRTINPNVTEKVVKWASYTTTGIVGALVTVAATHPPDFLQYIIVFTGGGFAATFLAVTFLGIFWPKMTSSGAIASMVGGFCTIFFLFVGEMIVWYLSSFIGLNTEWTPTRMDLLGLHPIFWGLVISFGMGIVVSLFSQPLPDDLVRKYFSKAAAE